MCGLSGLFDSKGESPPPRPLLVRMNETMGHRGPDGFGYHLEAGLGLGHARLSIIDIAGGHQPIQSEDGQVITVYNGEIYNFRELTRELAALGHTFASRSDSEVIVHAWEEWGPRCLERFRGMFAFALWDRRHKTLFLARDRLGIKPLHHALLPDGTFLFSSELKGILAHPDFPRALDEEAVECYLTLGYIPDPLTIFTHARKLPPGHFLLWRRGEPPPAPRSWWSLPPHAPLENTAQAAETLWEKVQEAVRIRLVADVPLGVFLSGGVDSSAITAAMAHEVGDSVKSCAITFADPAFDEGDQARQVARHLGCDHQERQVSTDDAPAALHLAALFDEPFADASALPTRLLSTLARERVKVALSGDGGDELFAGYRRYGLLLAEERLRSRIPPLLGKPLFSALGHLYPKLDFAPRFLRAKSTFQSMAMDFPDALCQAAAILPRELRPRLFAPAFRKRLQGEPSREIFRAHAQNAPGEDPLLVMRYVDLKTFLGARVLTKVDRASMAASLEVRVPFLDHPLVEWAFQLPDTLLIAQGSGKFILKQAASPHLPPALLGRPKKGFMVPLDAWFRGPLARLAQEMVDDGPLCDNGFLNSPALRRLLAIHQSNLSNYGEILWSLLLLDGFLRGITQ